MKLSFQDQTFTRMSSLLTQNKFDLVQDLMTAQETYVIKYDLHLTYLVTPVAEDILGSSAKTQAGQWCMFLQMYNQRIDANASLRRIAQFCGITPEFTRRHVFLFWYKTGKECISSWADYKLNFLNSKSSWDRLTFTPQSWKNEEYRLESRFLG